MYVICLTYGHRLRMPTREADRRRHGKQRAHRPAIACGQTEQPCSPKRSGGGGCAAGACQLLRQHHEQPQVH